MTFPLRIGLVGIGLDTYWPQFPGLKERLQSYTAKVASRLERDGIVTLLSVVETADNRLKLLVAKGESVLGTILEIGNTNSRYRFSIGVRRFINDWNALAPAHHCAVGIGHLAPKLSKIAQLLGITTVQIC